jgi:hypothetical protein
MKKLLFTVIALFGCILSKAQNVPSIGFEDWVDKKTSTLEDFITLGDVSQSTDAKKGSYSIKLVNTNGPGNSDIFGLVANTEISSKLQGGEPYDEAPLSLRFEAKYDLALGDAGTVISAFMLNGNVLGYASIILEGNSGDTFTRFSVPITWNLSAIPDSVIIVISSKDLETDTLNGDGYLIVDDLHFTTVTTRNKAIANGDFEKWGTTTRSVPKGWFTTDDYLEAVGAKSNDISVSKTNDKHGGASAVRLESIALGADPAAGIVLTGKGLENFEKPAFSVSKNFKYLEGWYKYTPQGGDSLYIAIGLFKAGTPIAYALWQSNTPKNDWTYFSIPITYFIPSIMADSATIVAAGANPDAAKGVGTLLFLDDLQLSDTKLSVEELNLYKLHMYPNPIQNIVKLDGIPQLTGTAYMIVDLNGRIVSEGEIDYSHQLDLSNLEKGMYFLNLHGDAVRLSKLILKQ